ASLVILDAVGTQAVPVSDTGAAKKRAIKFLQNQLKTLSIDFVDATESEAAVFQYSSSDCHADNNEVFCVSGYSIPCGPLKRDGDQSFFFETPTTALNALRVARGMVLSKALLLEGSPGAGKTSLIISLGRATGNEVVRINLSEQNDMVDLFGTDLPDEEFAGTFSWRDGPLLGAMRAGKWVLLDELNLASQSVLEGLNACLDHRGEVYIPELNKTFCLSEKTKIFACQNPLAQGGQRKGLPQSFLNRFTKVYIDRLNEKDMMCILGRKYKAISACELEKMVSFNSRLQEEIMVQRLSSCPVRGKFGSAGFPWEFNLRDLFRWADLMVHDQPSGLYNCESHIDTLYYRRMRTKEDRGALIDCYKNLFCVDLRIEGHPYLHVTHQFVHLGAAHLPRLPGTASYDWRYDLKRPLFCTLAPLQAVAKCLEVGWLPILVGPSCSGKTSAVRWLASITGNTLTQIIMNSSVDTMELLGGYEQIDFSRHLKLFINELSALHNYVSAAVLSKEESFYSERVETVRQLFSNYDRARRLLTVNSSGSEFSGADCVMHFLEDIRALNVDKIASTRSLELRGKFQRLRDLHAAKIQGCFEWVDVLWGSFFNSTLPGHWFLVEHANLCSSSVLDRLNPLLEIEGQLIISERGVLDGALKVFALFLLIASRLLTCRCLESGH
ncbi:hypothetical protein Zmor_003869, partial [Zophobas morio]